MSTSLAEQLQKLAKPQTTLLTRDKKKPSLLFDAKEAATLRFEDVYQIGVDGLEELISKSPMFEQFRSVLFDTDSKTLQRAVESKEFNKNLNKLIKKFLTVLSPYFLLNCSHKALEWLIHRFYIHEYNREDILCLILPYHETNIFIRMLQLLVIKDTNDNFFFLKPLQKPGLHLPKQSLLNHAASNPYFLEFTSNYILSIVKLKEKSTNFTVAFNYYCSVFCGALEYSKEVTEAHLSSMLPALSKGLKSNNLDFRAATFVIIARLVSKTELSHKLLDVFVGKIAEYFDTRQTTPEAIALLLIIYQKQEKYGTFPSGALQKMAKQEHFPVILQAMSNSGDYIDPLLEVIFRVMILEIMQTNDDRYKQFMKNILDKMKFDHQFVDSLLSLILEVINKNYPFKKECQSWLRQVIETLETQYPEQFNKSINSVLLGSDLKKKSCLKKLFRQSMLMDSKFKLFEKLHNPNPYIRNEALQCVSSDFKRLNETDKVMIKDFLVDRLYDDDPQVVESALNSLVSIPDADIDKIELKRALKELFLKYQRKKVHKTTSMKILECLVNNSEISEHEILIVLTPYFVSDSYKPKELKKLMGSLKRSKFSKSSLIRVDQLECSLTSNKELYETFIAMLNDNSDSSIVLKLVKGINVEIQDRDALYTFLVLLVSSNLTPKGVNERDGLVIIEAFREILKCCNFQDKKLKIIGEPPCKFNYVCKYLDKARTGILYVEFYLQCLSKIFTKVDVSSNYSDNLGVVNLLSEEKFKLFVNVADIFIQYFDDYKEYTFNFLKTICKTTVNQCEFLLNCLLLDGEVNVVENYYNIILSLLSDQNESINSLTTFDSVTVPYLLILLSNEKESVRMGALNVLETLVNESHTNKRGPYLLFVQELLKNKEEILLDHEEMPLLMFSSFCTNKNKSNFSEVQSEFLKLISSDNNPIYLRAGLVNLLSLINSVDIFECTSRLAKEILSHTPGSNELNKWQNSIVLKNIQQIELSIAEKITFDSNIWKFLEKALQDDQTKIEYSKEKLNVSVLTMKQISRDFFASLNIDLKLKLLDLVIDLTICTENAMILPEANRLFENIDIDATLIQDHLVKMRDVQSTKVDPNQSKRRRRIGTIIPTIDILDTFDWRKGVAVLEFTQGKHITDDGNLLLPLFFGNLKRCLDFDEQVSVEYPKQLLLSAIHQTCLKFKGSRSIAANLFNVELIVQCIRVSQNPQTHHHALLLLTKLSELVPLEVLQHIIPIFTFVGSSVLRYDDAYSFHILLRVINEVIPILVAEKTTIKIVDILRVFVYAIVDVPDYRRKPLYKQLLSNIEVEKNLYLFLLLVFESTVSNNAGQKNHRGIEKKRCQIAADLCREFHPKIVITNCIKLLEYLCSLPDDKTNNIEIESDVINISHFTPEQFHHYKYTLIDFIKDLITSKEFVFQVAELSDDELSAMVNLNANMVVNILMYVQRVTKVIDRSDRSVHKRYWEKIQDQSFQILNGIYALLTCEMFLRVTQGLMVYRLGKVQKQALELLNYKLEHSQEFFSQCGVEDFDPLINQLIETVKKCQVINLDDVEQERIIQISVNSLILIVKLLGSKYPEHFKTTMEIIVGLLKSNLRKGEILASLILCSAELFANLRSHAIPYLSSYMRDILKMLKKERKQEDPDPLLLLPLLTAINKILQVFPLFLSPYLPKILTSVSLLSSMYRISADESHMLLKLENIKQIIGTQIPLRVLVPSIEEAYTSLLTNSCYKSIGSVMDILKESLKVNKPDVMLSQLTKFFLEVFQFRINSTCSFSEATAVEEHIVQAFVALILKLSESKFKPLYNGLYKWATEEVDKSNRIVTFYNVTKNISEHLKGLFVLFASIFINNAAEVLEGCNIVSKGDDDDLSINVDAERNVFLLQSVLKSLHNVFSYDSHKFVNKDKFNVLMQPLVDQLENTLGGIECLQQRSTELLIPCIVSFCVAIADDSLWKQLNYRVLLKMRHSSPEIRLLGLECLTAIIKRLGEEFLPLLPETIPFLAELLEDENETVEKACQKAVQEMEKALGESLQKYF